MQNILGHWNTIIENHKFSIPYNPESCLCMVDLIDVAKVVSKIMLNPSHYFATYQIVGQCISHNEIAKILTYFLGTKIRVETLFPDKLKNEVEDNGMHDESVVMLSKMFSYYDMHGFRGNNNILSWLLDRSPTTYNQFLKRIFTESI